MISLFDNCLFIHIPKTAGQSIESVFLERAGLDWEHREQFLLKPNDNPEKGPPRLAHLTAQEYLDFGYLTQNQFTRLYKFSFVRNPWDRLVSEYRYKNHTISFKDFIFKYFPEHGNDDYVGFNGIYRHVMPQYQFLYDSNGKLMVDFVGKFENIQQDFAMITKKLFRTALTLPHKNKTSDQGILKRLSSSFSPNKKTTYQDYYDKESEQYIAQLYQKDIELFDYSF